MSDCIIIGAGIIGMMTARELAKAGLNVTLLDRQQAGQESSWAGGGILAPLFSWRYPDAVTHLAQYSQRYYEDLSLELLEQTGIDSEWQRDGLIVVGNDEQQQVIKWAADFDYKVEIFDKKELPQLEPQLADHFDSALYFPEIAQIRNPRLVKAMHSSLDDLNIKLLENTAVDEILTNQNRVIGVTANGLKMEANQVVVASGAWSANLLKPLYDLKVEPVRGQMLSFKAQPKMLQHIVLGSDHYLIPRRDGRILAGSTLEYVGFDKVPTQAAFEKLYKRALNIVPSLAECPLELQWSGLRPGNEREGVPFIEAVEDIEGLYVNTGHFRNGVILGLASARLMADLVLGRDPILDPGSFRH